MSIGSRIRHYRESNGMTQTDLASRIGVTCQAISQYERDIRQPKSKMAIEIARALSVDVSLLYKDLDESKSIDNINLQDRIYNTISKHYEEQGKEIVDIVYSIVNEMWTIKIAERYTAHGNKIKVRVVEERMTEVEVYNLINENKEERISSTHIRYIIRCLDNEIKRYEDILKVLEDNDVDDNTKNTIKNKIEYIDNIVDMLEKEL